MTFDDITGDRKLWAVHFEGEDDNEFYKVFNNWADVVWLRTFFNVNTVTRHGSGYTLSN